MAKMVSRDYNKLTHYFFVRSSQMSTCRQLEQCYFNIHWHDKVVRVTALPVTEDIEGNLQRFPLRWRHNERDSQPHDCLLIRSFRRISKKTSKLRVTGLCAGNSPETGEFPAQMASNAENVPIWWRHHAVTTFPFLCSYHHQTCVWCQ